MSGADKVLAVFLPGDEGLAEAPCGASQHHCGLGEQVCEPPYDEVQLPLPAGLDVDLSCCRNVWAVLCGRPSWPWNEREGGRRQK